MKTLDQDTRVNLPGDFIEISNGVVHYEIAGPENGTLVTLIHGMATSMFGWDRTCEALAQSGFRILRYDLFGRGFSDRPDTIYDLELYIRQLRELLSVLNVDQKVNLIGWSMGAAISAAFTKQFPDHVDKVVWLAPAGFPAERAPFLKLFTIPVISDILMALVGEKLILKGLRGHFYNRELLPAYIEKFKLQMEYDGFMRAIHSTAKHFPWDLTDTFKQVGDQQRPILLIWGEQDEITPYRFHQKVLELMPSIEFFSVSEAKHAVHYEKPELVNQRIVEFLRQ